MIPARGVYVVGVDLQGKSMYGMMNIGVRPTVSAGLSETMEVHIFGVMGDLYGETLRVQFLKRLRDEKRFSNIQELTEQLRRDREDSMRYLSHLTPSPLVQRT
jgi:riboflavin kinase/FMN adenylyltransferase